MKTLSSRNVTYGASPCRIALASSWDTESTVSYAICRFAWFTASMSSRMANLGKGTFVVERRRRCCWGVFDAPDAANTMLSFWFSRSWPAISSTPVQSPPSRTSLRIDNIELPSESASCTTGVRKESSGAAPNPPDARGEPPSFCPLAATSCCCDSKRSRSTEDKTSPRFAVAAPMRRAASSWLLVSFSGSHIASKIEAM